MKEKDLKLKGNKQMANMSYCRFHNTLIDLRDCYANITEIEDMSESELQARKKLIELCQEIAQEADYYLELEAE